MSNQYNRIKSPLKYLHLMLLVLYSIGNAQSIDTNVILLFKNYEDKLLKESHITEYLISEKLDGIRAIWDGKVMKTRNGKIIPAPTCWIKSFPPFPLDGELWTKRNDFENISSIVRQQKPTCKSWDRITYYVFDVIPPYNFNKQLCQTPTTKTTKNLPSECSLLGRLTKIQNYLDSHPHPHITVLQQEVVKSKKALYEKLRVVTNLQGEGLIIRKNYNPYQGGRNNENLKLKKRQDSECKIIGYVEGKGKLQGKMGAVICTQTKASLRQSTSNNHNKLSIDSQTENISFKVGSGWNNTLRENPPKLGSIITYQYQGLTKNGIPRFPTFLRIYKE
ncbi:DNA ligase [Helicobacter aurati]|uniref:DNA ligase n=1 Tax=Helicobacter aurati TaxID=137778 RepID=A0A3D8J4C8_9HELI|nr:DNA ligase [Helicobacter aurati]RDU72318.1 DNA ligase [Helicobacter aurati]